MPRKVVQEAFLRGDRKLKSFELRSDFGTWIYRIAVRCALDRMASRKTAEASQIAIEDDPEQHAVQLTDAAPGPQRILLSGGIGALQQMAMRGLTPVERIAFVLRHLEKQSTEEIAIALGIAPNSAKQAVYCAVQKLRQGLAVLRVKA